MAGFFLQRGGAGSEGIFILYLFFTIFQNYITQPKNCKTMPLSPAVVKSTPCGVLLEHS
jgi:hypothetical protein